MAQSLYAKGLKSTGDFFLVPYLLRKLDPAKWTDESAERLWTLENDCPANPIGDISTTKSKLSVWYIENDTFIEEVITAISTNYQEIKKVGYVLVDEQILNENGFTLQPSQGITPYIFAKQLHRDIVDLNKASQLIKLAKLIKNKGQFDHKDKKEVLDLLVKKTKEGKIDISKLNTCVRNEINKVINRDN